MFVGPRVKFEFAFAFAFGRCIRTVSICPLSKTKTETRRCCAIRNRRTYRNKAGKSQDCSTSTSNCNAIGVGGEDKDGTETETETIEAVFVFHRHGDRTPGRSLVTDEVAAIDESNFWKDVRMIPPVSCYEYLCERFPATLHPKSNNNNNSNSHYSNYSSFRETSGGNKHNKSYGFLTWKGMHQMYHNGVAMARRYGPKKHKREDGMSVVSSSFRDRWDVKAASTNYLRTVMSCQAFLDGLLTNNNNNNNTKSRLDGDDNEMPLLIDYSYPTHYERIPFDKHRTTNHKTTASVEIEVRECDASSSETSATLNAFDTSPKLMKTLVGDVWGTPEFMGNDQRARPLMEELSEYLPGLLQRSKQDGGTINTNNNNKNKSINWIDASDHFVCRSSHSIPAHQFCPHLLPSNNDGDDNTKESRFAALGTATLLHLRQRFHSYYSNPSLLGEMTGPALREAVLEMKTAAEVSQQTRTTTTKKKTKKKPFRIYSCHDVTILALLYAIQNDPYRSIGSEQPLQWPTYATCLTLELVRCNDNRTTDTSVVAAAAAAAATNERATETSNDDDDDGTMAGASPSSLVVRAWLNEAPVPVFSRSPVAFATARNKNEADDDGEEPPLCFEIELSRFEALVHKLNEARVVHTSTIPPTGIHK